MCTTLGERSPDELGYGIYLKINGGTHKSECTAAAVFIGLMNDHLLHHSELWSVAKSIAIPIVFD